MIRNILFTANDNQNHICPMIAAWHDRWYVGREVEAYANVIPSHKIMRNFKLLSYDAHKNSPQARRVEKQLKEAGKTPHHLLCEVVRYVWNDILTDITERLCIHHVDQYETFVYFCVPMLATFEITKQLKAAAKEAGISRGGFVYEPMCAAACIIKEIMKEPTWGGRIAALVRLPMRDIMYEY